MDWLTFVSEMWDATGDFAWPAAFVVVVILFRKSIETLILSLKSVRYKDIEMELAAPQETSRQELDIIVHHLRRSPHSFQWFRDNTEISYSDEQFRTLIATHPKILEDVTVVSGNELERKSRPGRPGMRLAQEYRQNIDKLIQNE